MSRNSTRFDLSPYLIHFFREIDLTKGDTPPLPEHWGFGNIAPDGDYISPRFLLRCAIRHSLVWATWSPRKGVRTIYGPSPAVCFTEMPIAAFLEAGTARWARGENMSPYGLVFPKTALYARGANPVIYGLDHRNAILPKKQPGPRLIAEELLPLREQYRYVTYNPTASLAIDWTHEREWRLPYRGEFEHIEAHTCEYGTGPDIEEYRGLSLVGEDLNGMGVIVGSERETREIAYDILTLVDRDVVNHQQYRFILCTERLPKTVELREPEAVKKIIEEATVDLLPYFQMTAERATALEEQFSKIAETIEDTYAPPTSGEPGRCWLWLSDNTHDLTRALLLKERIIVSNEGRYLVALDEFEGERSLRQREEMAAKLATELRATFGVDCVYFSVLGSNDPNDVPFYTSPHLQWPFYNDATDRSDR